jgi:hypothetical protein
MTQAAVKSGLPVDFRSCILDTTLLLPTLLSYDSRTRDREEIILGERGACLRSRPHSLYPGA